MTHVTVKKRGQVLRPNRCPTDATLFTCPFCKTDAYKPREYHHIMTHLAGHKLRAIEHGDQVIYSCNLGCGKKPKHFHCCQCPNKTFMNKSGLKSHLCSNHPVTTVTEKLQPVVYPLQLFPSQQPIPQPPPEPPAQKPADPAAPPENGCKQISVQCLPRHITIKQRGQVLRPKRCSTDATLFTCLFCTTDAYKPREYHQIMTHLAGHKLRAIEHGDQVIYSCNLGCDKKAKHFHCCQCPKTFINKIILKRHLSSFHPVPTCTREPQAVDPLPPSQQPAPRSPELAAPQEDTGKQISMQCFPRPITVQKRGQEPRPKRCPTDATLFTCPFCKTDAYKPREYHQIMTHLAGHKLRAIEHGDQVIYSCNLGCGKKAKHFHCCQCPNKTFMNKSGLKSHLCSVHPVTTSTPEPQPVIDSPQEPLSPEPEPDSPDLADLLVNEEISEPCLDRHITVQKRGHEPRPKHCSTDATLFTCPFCTTDVCKPREYHQIMTHLAGHKQRAIEHGDQVFYSCNLGCEKATHFHCCQCPNKTFMNESGLKLHLISVHPVTTCTPEPQPVIDSPQEPLSPEPDSPDLADLLVNEEISEPCIDRHITVLQRGQEPRPKCWPIDATLFTCPFCTTGVYKPKHYHQIMTHLAGHKQRAVEHGDRVIYNCNLGCDNKARHFHCCQCPKIFIQKKDLKRHLCSTHPIKMLSPELQPFSQKTAADSVTVRKRICVQCPHCGVSLNSKNLKKHIERKHCAAEHPITSTLPAQCVDKKNGIYVVSKSFSEPFALVHVAKKIWGSSHKVMCGMDVCNRHVEMAQKNDLLVKQCVHLSAVDNCCTVASTEDLSEDVLTGMVTQKRFEDISINQCLNQQSQALSEGATFASLVTIGRPNDVFNVSVYEPTTSRYSKLGRVLVSYNDITDRWQCPCSEAQTSCLHTSIAKWCLYQMKKMNFDSRPVAEIELELQ